MRKALALLLACILLLAGCDAASPRGEPQAAISREESSVLPDTPSRVEPLPDILLGAASVSYQTGGGWVSAAMDSDEAQSLTGALIALFPEKFGAVSAAYEPEEIVIRFSLKESAPHYVDVNSGPAPDVKEMEISSIEINRGGILFLLPQGAALGKVKDVETLLPAAPQGGGQPQ